MAYTRQGPWAQGDPFTSAQATAMDLGIYGLATAMANIQSKIVEDFFSSDTWLKPEGCVYVEVELIGGGGGGGSVQYTAGGGGGGGYVFVRIPAFVLGPTESVVVGAGGAPSPSAGTPGGAGGSSEFSVYKAVGGGGGTSQTGGASGGTGGGGGGITLPTWPTGHGSPAEGVFSNVPIVGPFQWLRGGTGGTAASYGNGTPGQPGRAAGGGASRYNSGTDLPGGAGGTSPIDGRLLGGNGGGSNQDGQAPGGGGGARNGSLGGNGAPGQVRITSYLGMASI